MTTIKSVEYYKTDSSLPSDLQEIEVGNFKSSRGRRSQNIFAVNCDSLAVHANISSLRLCDKQQKTVAQKM